MAIKVFTPQVQVLLIKTTGLARGQAYRGASSGVDFADLTELLGDAGAVRTVKGVDGESGGFSVSFADGVQNDLADTAYALIEPMDMVEIRMARLPLGGGELPIVMRGFVSSVRRAETIAEDGRPMRVVVVQGQDETKLWYNFGIYPENIYRTTGDFLDRFRLLAATKIAVVPYRVADFMAELVDCVNQKVAEMSAYTDAGIPQYAYEGTVPEGIVSPSLIAPLMKGAYWDIAGVVADRPWNELFIESREEGPVVIFRPVPYFHLDGGGLIMPGAADPGQFERDAEHVVTWDTSRTDHRVANFFWVEPAGGQLDSSGGVNVAAQRVGAVDSYGNPNSALEIFGHRKMAATTRLLPDALVKAPINYPPGEKLGRIDDQNQWHVKRAQQLRDLNQDNVAFEEISLVMQGHEEFRPGRYIRITRGQYYGEGLITKGYIEKVSHTFAPLRTFTTTLSVIRSDGFVQRDASLGMPYFFEGRSGPYSRE